MLRHGANATHTKINILKQGETMSYTILESGTVFETQALATAAAQLEADSEQRRVRIYPAADVGGADYLTVEPRKENTQ